MTKYYHVDIWGSREYKYSYLNENDFTTIEWKEIFPTSPFYLFIPQNQDLLVEYNQGWKITDIMPVNSSGIKTHRDHFALDFDADVLQKRIEDFINLNITDDVIAQKYNINDTNEWKIKESRYLLANNCEWEKYFTHCLYRPFDWRNYYHHQNISERPRNEVMRHLININHQNLAIAIGRQGQAVDDPEWSLVTVSKTSVDTNIFRRGGVNIFPLYIYPDIENDQYNLFTERNSNFSPNFLSEIKAKLGYIPTPEQIFYYAYAIFHSPTYRQRYAEYLKIDFPRLPLTSNEQLFKNLAQKGEELVKLHLMESQQLNRLITKYQGEGDNSVTEVTYKPQQQRVYINKTRYFEGILPEIWGFKIGGYQVLDKWLKDRKKANRSLSFDDVLHYQKIVIALTATLTIMKEIDQIIPE
ncbi:Adenine specific DNA methyltransferase [Planktothrix sp. PCC 11201]|uniref:type ISP restriction/modification enzyme n=1 Tax=Planktothrix sp. PCC 11201 TaxID=1729650 RepID=UPI000913ED80|nr:type ISP restriction/modification enzyme [Planktothrix sp. PCC 11201]SKB14813.1 Adenine specific DNA methyltransferase [Planktothrix sp. PCC 11201]